jgi:hypothetical protein
MNHWKRMALGLALVVGLCGGAWAENWGHRDGDRGRDSHWAYRSPGYQYRSGYWGNWGGYYPYRSYSYYSYGNYGGYYPYGSYSRYYPYGNYGYYPSVPYYPGTWGYYPNRVWGYGRYDHYVWRGNRERGRHELYGRR